MKILLLYPNAVLQNPPPVALALFAATLRALPGVELRLFDTTLYDLETQTSDKTKEANLQVRPFDFAERGVTLKPGDPFAALRHLAADFQPDLVALSCNEVTWPLGRRLLETVRGVPALKLAGGVFPTFAPETVLASGLVDAVVTGEGEAVLVELVQTLQTDGDWRGVNNIARLRSGTVVRNPLRPLVELDTLPLPDYSLFETGRYFRPMAGKVWKLFPIETSRGCPYQCAYCNSPAQARLYAGRGPFFRTKSIARIRRELESLVRDYGAEYIYFLSDTLLCVGDGEFDEFCRMYERIGLPFWCQNRPEMITPERARRLKSIGCHRMSLGIEHGNEQFRQQILGKLVSNETIIRACAILAEAGIPVSINNIIGFPDETRDLAMDTVRLNRRLAFDTVNAYAFVPFRGTPLYPICRSRGYLRGDREVNLLTKGTILEMPRFPPAEIDGLVRTFSLYARFPESDYGKIRIAERDDDEGRRAFAELSAEYRCRYFSGGNG